jgi:hypothetical protein
MIIPEGARNIEFLGHTDQGGRGDGVQVMVARGHAYIGTRVRRGVMVTDVRDPRNPKPVNFLAMHPNSVSMHLQAADDLLLCIQEADQRALLTQQEYYGGSGKVDSSRFGKRGEDYAAAGETPTWTKRYALHHAIVADDYAYGSWRDGGLTILDVKDKTAPKLIAHRNWCPPYGGGTHNAVPLHDRDLVVVADEAVLNLDQEGQHKRTWIFDIREKSNPVSISTMPIPADQDYAKMGGQFGPHNLHENRPGSFQSSTTIFATWQSAGVRVFDISNAYRPEEIGFFVPPQPTQWAEPMRGRAKVRHTADIFVSQDGLIYITDYDAGLYILQWKGN